MAVGDSLMESQLIKNGSWFSRGNAGKKEKNVIKTDIRIDLIRGYA